MIRMPWSDRTAPNLMIEVTDACNIACTYCYKSRGERFRTLAEIESDLDAAMKLRPLHTVTVTGGEPTLHPDLCRIVETIHARGLHTFLLTNGVLVDQPLLDHLRSAGLDSILFHVDPGQIRDDLGEDTGIAEVHQRLAELIESAHAAGLDVSMSVTLDERMPEVLTETCRFFFTRPELSFLFLARGADLAHLHGQKRTEHHSDPGAETGTTPGVAKIIRYFEEKYAIEPFAYIPTTAGTESVWISFFAPVVYRQSSWKTFRIRSNRVDAWLMELTRLLTGRYIHKTRQNTVTTLLRTLLNGLTTWRFVQLVAFLRAILRPSARLRFKMIAYDDGPFYRDGALVACEYCPTAIVRDDKLLPCCTADYPAGPKETKP